MSYLCKDCKNNNNGWCTVHKKQGLKSVTTCNEKNNNQATAPVKTPIKASEAKDVDFESMFQNDPDVAENFGQIFVIQSLLRVFIKFNYDKKPKTEIGEALITQTLGIAQTLLYGQKDEESHGKHFVIKQMLRVNSSAYSSQEERSEALIQQLFNLSEMAAATAKVVDAENRLKMETDLILFKAFENLLADAKTYC